MIIDIRELSCIDSFKHIREAVSVNQNNPQELLIFVDNVNGQFQMVKDFIKNCLGYNSETYESSGHYIIRPAGAGLPQA